MGIRKHKAHTKIEKPIGETSTNDEMIGVHKIQIGQGPGPQVNESNQTNE